MIITSSNITVKKLKNKTKTIKKNNSNLRNLLIMFFLNNNSLNFIQINNQNKIYKMILINLMDNLVSKI